jgi:hypothetical protein
VCSGRVLCCLQTGEGHSNHICHKVSSLHTGNNLHVLYSQSNFMYVSGAGNSALWAVNKHSELQSRAATSAWQKEKDFPGI